MSASTQFKQTNKWLFHILLIGSALGLANHFQGAFGGNLGQSVLINVFTSLGIGYPLVLLVYNEKNLLDNIKSTTWHRIVLLLIFIIIGLILRQSKNRNFKHQFNKRSG